VIRFVAAGKSTAIIAPGGIPDNSSYLLVSGRKYFPAVLARRRTVGSPELLENTENIGPRGGGELERRQPAKVENEIIHIVYQIPDGPGKRKRQRIKYRRIKPRAL
jgi:hypothetical protein